MKKLISIVVTLLILSSFTAIVIGNEADEQPNINLSNALKQTIKPIKKNIIGQTGLEGNILISDNGENDYHPRITENDHDQIVVVYEQYNDIFSQVIPVVYSDDGGESWVIQFIFDSYDFTDGSGTLQYPDICYGAQDDVLFLTMVDPYAELYNNEMSFIPGDIANAEEASWYGISGQDSTGYNYNANICTETFYLSLTTEDGYGMTQIFGLGYFTYPEFEHPPVMGGFYYDGQSEHESAPAAELEMDKNSNRIFIVCETEDKITIKSTVNDEDLLTNGEMQHGMDKYADIEQYPGEYLSDGSDPDVAGSGNKVAVVYVQDGSVKCSYSTCDAGTYDPGFSWQVSTVETGASAPAVHMSGDNVFCAYVKNGNLYLKTSEDAGASWGVAVQINDVDGTVIGEKGAVGISQSGIVFTDNRDGNYDIYFNPLAGGVEPQPEIVIESISGGIGVSATIKNIGDATAENFEWSIVSEGTVFLGGEKSGTETLDPGDSITVKTGLMLGFGNIDITVTADTAVEQASAKLLLFFVTGL